MRREPREASGAAGDEVYEKYTNRLYDVKPNYNLPPPPGTGVNSKAHSVRFEDPAAVSAARLTDEG